MGKIIGTAAALRSLWSDSADLAGETHGTFATAMPFVGWLEKTGQRAWQLLPLSETQLEPGSKDVHVPSPYKGYGIGLDPAYLSAADDAIPDEGELDAFRLKHADWLPDYAAFCAIRDRLGTDQWARWPKSLRDKDREALQAWTAEHAADVRRHEVLQWKAQRALDAVRGRAHASDIMIVGDLPFYVSVASPLVWAHRDAFDLAEDGRPRRVSGIPDSPKAHFGRQVWGHPLYRWTDAASAEEAMRVWKLRLSYHAHVYDLMRLDHAKGLFRFGSVDPEDPTRDAVLEGPGTPALEALVRHARAAGLELFAEDSGDWLDDLRETLKRLRVPGIRILRFAYNEKRKAIEQEYADVANYPEDSVAYTTTHDTDTLLGYVRKLDEAERRHLCEHVGVAYDPAAETVAARLRGALLASSARVRIVQIQDWLLTEDRINVPGTEKPVGDPNWRYRMTVPIEALPTGLL